MGKRAAVQGRPFALVRAYAANTHQVGRGVLIGQSGVRLQACEPRAIDSRRYDNNN